MQNKTKQLIASKYNASGNRIFIPLAIRIDGIERIIPFRIQKYLVSPQVPAIYSSSSEATVALVFSQVERVFTQPFTADEL